MATEQPPGRIPVRPPASPKLPPETPPDLTPPGLVARVVARAQTHVIDVTPLRTSRQFRLLWIGAGTGEEAMHQGAQTMHEALDKAGVKNVFYESSGTSHEWQTWRRDLREFAGQVFR